MNLPGAVSTARVPERVRALLTELNLHYAGAAVLLLINLWLIGALLFSWRTAANAGPDALAQQQTNLRLAELQARPLEGLDAKLLAATSDADTFYQRRLPSNWSQVLTELGTLTRRENVRLTRVQYAPVPVLDNTAAALTEVRMDAALTGDYRSLVGFINSLERDRMFFLISAVTLTGQQNGIVGLRMRVNTWLRPGEADTGLTTSSDALAAPAVEAAPALATPATNTVPVAPSALRQGATTRQTVAPRSAPPQTQQAPAQEYGGPNFVPPPGGPPEIRSGHNRLPGGRPQ